uniref:Caspase-8 n=1 Tax=Leptobrachium leishanense TaxID=445787 RepID=A0A8C5WDX7_9ANUR
MDNIRSSVDDFLVKLHNISSDLEEDEERLMIFLCKDHITNASSIKDSSDLFIKLQECCLLTKQDTFILQELLYYTGRFDLLKKYLEVGESQVKKQITDARWTKISPFRCLLLDLSQNVVKEELDKIKKLLKNDIAVSKMEKITCLPDIFIELEKAAVIGEDKLDKLKEIFTEINQNLLDKITQYEKNKKEDQRKCLNPECHAILHRNQSHSDEPSRDHSTLQNIYEMSKSPHGVCVIINNYNFETARRKYANMVNLKDRCGTDKDEESLRRVFSKLDFIVISHKDLTGGGILQTIQDYSEQTHENSDCFICVILSHGNRGVIYGTDGESVAILKLTSGFKKSKCPSLAGKPKVFFIQACQGGAFQKSVQVEADASNACLNCEVSEADLIPNEPDFLLGMATTQDHVSFRHREVGSWYIQALCNQLERSFNRGEDIQLILTRVNNEVSQNQRPQMPEPCTTLHKQLCFSMKSLSI